MSISWVLGTLPGSPSMAVRRVDERFCTIDWRLLSPVNWPRAVEAVLKMLDVPRIWSMLSLTRGSFVENTPRSGPLRNPLIACRACWMSPVTSALPRLPSADWSWPLVVTVTLARSLGVASDTLTLPESPLSPGTPVTVSGNCPCRLAVTD